MHGYGWGMEKVDGSSLLNLEKGFLHLQFIFCLQTWKSEWKYKINIYYINTSEIPSELSRENFISSHVKITCYLHT